MNKYNIITLLLGVFVAVSGFLYVNQSSTELNVGTELPQSVALFETSLAAPITSSATTMTLTSNSIRGGGSLSGYNCFTIDEGSAQAEFVCGTASSTSVTGLLRGISPSDGITEDADLKFSHRRGASVKITDFPIIQLLRAQNNGDGTFENVIRYASDVVPVGASDLADVGYVLSVVNGGSVDFDALTVAGRAGETVATGTLVYFNRTDQEWYKVNVTSTSTFYNRSIGITQGPGVNGGSVSGGILLKGRSTVNTGLTAGSIYYASTSGAIATTSSVFAIGESDSTSVLYFDPVLYDVPRLGWDNTFTGTTTFTGNVSGALTVNLYTSSSTWTKPAGAKVIEVIAIGGGGGGAGGTSGNPGNGGAGGAGGQYVRQFFQASVVSSTVSVVVGTGGTGGAAALTGTSGATSTFGSYVSAAGGTAGTGTAAREGLIAIDGVNNASSISTSNLGASGAGASGSGVGGSGVSGFILIPTGGGGGGGNNDTTGNPGGSGGSISGAFTLAGGTAGIAGGGNAGSGNTLGAAIKGGTGGGGGGSRVNGGNGGDGGDGALYGGGGGGGGGSELNTGGSGGDGANGVVLVITY